VQNDYQSQKGARLCFCDAKTVPVNRAPLPLSSRWSRVVNAKKDRREEAEYDNN
jgi:hypothetical protein